MSVPRQVLPLRVEFNFVDVRHEHAAAQHKRLVTLQQLLQTIGHTISVVFLFQDTLENSLPAQPRKQLRAHRCR